LLAASLANHLDPGSTSLPMWSMCSDLRPWLCFRILMRVSGEVAQRICCASPRHRARRKQGNLKSCIFTEPPPEPGSQQLRRAYATFSSDGKAHGAPGCIGHICSTERANGSVNGLGTHRSSSGRARQPLDALLQQVAEEAGTHQGSLVLTDAAPLVISAETEYLARFVDCAIVVAESGVTTRAQLWRHQRAAAARCCDCGFCIESRWPGEADPAFAIDSRNENHRRAQSRPQRVAPERERRCRGSSA